MKYIRTKDGRIIDIPSNHRLINYGNETIVDIGAIANGERGHAIINGIIEKQADTIEELCDYFSFDNAFECLNPSLYCSVSTARLRAKNHENLIGYIVIEKKGVKTIEPVARTNGEGKFELL